jgi:hypothetical protein
MLLTFEVCGTEKIQILRPLQKKTISRVLPKEINSTNQYEIISLNNEGFVFESSIPNCPIQSFEIGIFDADTDVWTPYPNNYV